MANEFIIPGSVDEALDRAMGLLSKEEKSILRGTPDDQLSLLHFGLAAKLRNDLGLWRDDASSLLEKIANFDPTHRSVNDWGNGEYSVDADGASAILLKALRYKVMNEQS